MNSKLYCAWYSEVLFFCLSFVLSFFPSQPRYFIPLTSVCASMLVFFKAFFFFYKKKCHCSSTFNIKLSISSLFWNIFVSLFLFSLKFSSHFFSSICISLTFLYYVFRIFLLLSTCIYLSIFYLTQEIVCDVYACCCFRVSTEHQLTERRIRLFHYRCNNWLRHETVWNKCVIITLIEAFTHGCCVLVSVSVMPRWLRTHTRAHTQTHTQKKKNEENSRKARITLFNETKLR